MDDQRVAFVASPLPVATQRPVGGCVVNPCHRHWRLLGTYWAQRGTYIDGMADQNSGREFMRARARKSIERGLKALEAGAVPFGNWERLHLTAALDEFRNDHFESALEAAERIDNSALNRRRFPGRFSQEKGLDEYRAEFERLKNR